MKTCVVAFSGGLDTSYIVASVKEKYGFEKIVTCTVNTGGFTPDEMKSIEARAYECGAHVHYGIDAQDEFFSEVIKYLIFGNVSRDGYPLCVGSERLIQARAALKLAHKENAQSFIHGSTGAGNDQYRFDVASYVIGQGSIKVIAPVREGGVSREESTKYLLSKGISVPEKNSKYSYNVGMWGVSIGGTETHSSSGILPEGAWHKSEKLIQRDVVVRVSFEKGVPVSLSFDSVTLDSPVEIISALNDVGYSLGIGRHYQVGTALPGKKGRLGYQSPASDILYEAHRVLEKHTLTQKQIGFKKIVAEEFGKLIHEAHFLDPLIEDLRAFLISSQERVSGEVEIVLSPFRINSAVVKYSPYDLLMVKGAVYGEISESYSGRDAEGAAKLHGFEQRLWWSLKK